MYKHWIPLSAALKFKDSGVQLLLTKGKEYRQVDLVAHHLVSFLEDFQRPTLPTLMSLLRTSRWCKTGQFFTRWGGFLDWPFWSRCCLFIWDWWFAVTAVVAEDAAYHVFFCYSVPWGFFIFWAFPCHTCPMCHASLPPQHTDRSWTLSPIISNTFTACK